MTSTIIEKLNWRYAVKRFDPSKKIPAEQWKVLEESLRLSPSSYGLQPWKFWIVQNPELREKLKAAAFGQGQVTDCSHFVVMIHKEKMDQEYIQKYVDKMVNVRGVAVESLEKMKATMVRDLINGPRSMIIDHWSERQTYLAMGFLMTSAALLEIDTCPMEGLDPKQYDKILKLEGTGWKTVAAVACGYRHPEDKFQTFKKVRFDHQDIFKTL